MRKPIERKMGHLVATLAADLPANPELGKMMYGQAADVPRISFVPLDEIAPNPGQPRKIFDADALVELTESIKRLGVLQPISVTQNPHSDGPKWMIVAGERRWRASKLASLSTIPAIVTGKDLEEVALVENIQREDLHPIEIARAIQKLATRHGYGQNEVAAVIGKSRGDVSKLMKILTLPADFLEFALTNGVSRRTLYEIASGDNPAVRAYALMAEGQPEPETAQEAPIVDRAKRRGRLPMSESLSRAVSAFSGKLQKVESAHLSSEQLTELATLRQEIDRLLGDRE